MKIHYKIEELRRKLNELSVSEHGLTSDNLIKLSQELDKLIHKYYEIYFSGRTEAACTCQKDKV